MTTSTPHTRTFTDLSLPMDIQAFGHFLREAREQREISLEEAVKTLKIQKRILESFEEGDFSQGGSPVQVRGMLRNYARFLRLEEDVVLGHYETALIPPKTGRWRKRATDESQAVRPATQPRRDTLTIPLAGSPRRNTGPRFAWVGRVLTTLIGFGLIGIIIFLVGQILSHTPPPDGSAQPTLAAQISTLDPALATETYTATFTPLPEEPTRQATLIFLNGSDGSVIELNFVQSSWVRVVGDGEEQYAGIARPGETQTYNVAEGIEITVANAAAIELSVNGQVQPALGERGRQVLVLINATGLQVIHPGATPTLDASRIIVPESITITETPDPALQLTPTIAEVSPESASPTVFDATPIGADLIPTDIPPTEAAALSIQAANVDSATPDPSLLGNQQPTLTPFSFLPGTGLTEPTSTAVQITPAASMTPIESTPTIAAQANTGQGQATTQPTLTPFNFLVQATSTAEPTDSSAEVQPPSATQEQQQQASQSSQPQVQASTPTLTPSRVPTNTPTPTATGTPDIRPTAIVPLRITQSGVPTKKAP